SRNSLHPASAWQHPPRTHTDGADIMIADNEPVPLPALHPELIVARRNVALASDKLRALQDEALRLSVFVIPCPDRIDALIDIARANGLFDKFRRDDIEHVIGQGSRGIPTLAPILNAASNNSRLLSGGYRQGPQCKDILKAPDPPPEVPVQFINVTPWHRPPGPEREGCVLKRTPRRPVTHFSREQAHQKT